MTRYLHFSYDNDSVTVSLVILCLSDICGRTVGDLKYEISNKQARVRKNVSYVGFCQEDNGTSNNP